MRERLSNLVGFLSCPAKWQFHCGQRAQRNERETRMCIPGDNVEVRPREGEYDIGDWCVSGAGSLLVLWRANSGGAGRTKSFLRLAGGP